MSDANRELDIEIVSTSWRSVSDSDAFGEMIEAWNRKLAAAKKQPRMPLIDRVLRDQLMSIDRLLDDRREIQIEDPLEKAVSETPAAAMVLSPEGIVANLNAAAEDSFGVSQGMRAGVDWLRPDCVADYRAVRNSVSNRRNSQYAIVRLNHLSNDGLFAEVYRLSIEENLEDYVVVRSLQLDWHPSVTEALEKAFGLTSAETEICRLLFTYLDLSRVADQRSVSLETVRTQVKRILAKIEAHSKTELIRLLGLLCASSSAKREKLDLSWSDPLKREKFLTRFDGRKIGYSWIGAEDGRPVLFIPDQMSCNYFPELVRSNLEDEGIKLYILSLPGFGNSDPPISKSQLDDGCDAIEQFCEQLASGPIPSLAFRSAQPYLFRVSSLRPDLFNFLLCIGLPLNITEMRKACLDPLDATMLKLAQQAPVAYELVCRIGYRLMQNRGPDFYWSKLYSRNQADLETVANQELRPLLRASVRHIAAKGFSTFKRSQLLLADSPVQNWVRASSVPFHWIVPELSVTMRDEDFLEVMDLNALSTLEIVANTGDLLPFQRPELFVDRVVALSSDDPHKEFSRQFANTFEIHRSD
ncbi:hypothetical protein BPTFM16_02612 [Altererythrobacter insulae]|nr:hypothetical protein BPTFM16_02612 [Altererythrobacter insulae]